MYKLSNFNKVKNENDKEKLDFINLYKTTWDKIHTHTDVFRYKVNYLRERIVDEKYLLQLNPDRSSKRRTPEQIENICQPFDKKKFNFTKVSEDEIIFTFVGNDDETNEHTLLVNVSPISQYHSLLCPSKHKCLPQVVTADSLQLIINIIFLAKDRNLRIGFNSLCGLASVNHLHYHLFLEKNVLPIEIVKCKHLKGPVYFLSDEYPVPAFCFELTPLTVNPCENIFKVLEVLLNKSIAHNIFITRGSSLTEGNDGEEIVRVLIWPRKSSAGAKQLSAFNVAVCEFSGWFPVHGVHGLHPNSIERSITHVASIIDQDHIKEKWTTPYITPPQAKALKRSVFVERGFEFIDTLDEDIFENIRSKELEDELKKWSLDNFDGLCDEIKGLY